VPRTSPTLLAPLAAVALPGCGPDAATVVAEKGGWARFPANSEAAVAASLYLDEAAIEVDLFLTNDRIPVLVDGPRLDKATCTTVDGDAIGGDVWLIQNDLADLDAGYRCGVEPDPAWPDARVGAAPVHTLDALLDQVEADPPTAVLLDLRWIPNVSHAPEVFAAEVLERWWRDAPPTALRIVADRPEMIAAAEDRARAAGVDVVTLLRWPTEPARGSAGGARFASTLAADAGVSDPWAAVEDAGADGLIAHADVLRRADVARRPAGAELGLQGADTEHPAAAWLGRDDWVLDATGGVE
jgi:glycerophosphoryl diester phosphodiesterase